MTERKVDRDPFTFMRVPGTRWVMSSGVFVVVDRCVGVCSGASVCVVVVVVADVVLLVE